MSGPERGVARRARDPVGVSSRSVTVPDVVPADEAAEAMAFGMPLEDRLSTLVHAIGARIGSIVNRHYRVHELNQLSARVLVLLLQHEELRPAELVELMVLPQSTISSQLQILHAKRLIRRRRSRKDNRSVILTLTPAGQERAHDCNQLSLRVHEALFADISARESRAGFAFLRKLDARLVALERQDPDPFADPVPEPAVKAAPARKAPARKPRSSTA